MRGDTLALVLSILGLLATLFLYKLGSDIRRIRIKKQRMTLKEHLHKAVQKCWKHKKL